MSEIIELLTALNTISPLGIVALLALVIFFQVKNQKSTDLIADNHLSGLPELSETVDKILESTLRQERLMAALDSYLRARLNGNHK